jgi:hypothetical protein
MTAVRYLAGSEIHWDAIVLLLQQNPKIHDFILAPVKFLALISFDDIRRIAIAAPNLDRIVLVGNEKMGVKKWSPRAILRSKEERRLASEFVSIYDEESYFDEKRLSIDLAKFRAL